ncbi:hypothetical protein OAB47_03340 [Vicingaceae bacterium]|nr:hypothetical protein [Vicingaceae bacterium]
MNLKNTYPEIDNFFKKVSFNEHDIDLLINTLSTKYSSLELIRVKNVFNLKLMGYGLEKEEKKLEKNVEKFKKPTDQLKIENKNSKKEKKKDVSRIDLKNKIKIHMM